MIFLKSISDLRSLMGSHRLFSGDPVTLHIPELNPEDSITSESRINQLKNEKGWIAGIKSACIVMAVLSGILLNIPGYEGGKLIDVLPFILAMGIVTGIAVKFFTIVLVKIRLKSEIRKLLRRIDSLGKAYARSWQLE